MFFLFCHNLIYIFYISKFHSQNYNVTRNAYPTQVWQLQYNVLESDTQILLKLHEL